MKMPCLVCREVPQYEEIIFTIKFSDEQIGRMHSSEFIESMFVLIKIQALRTLSQMGQEWRMEEIRIELNPRRFGANRLIYLAANPTTPEIDLTGFPPPKYTWEK